jgi:hypothetical protein
MIRVTRTRQGAVPDEARPPSFGLDVLLADLSKPERTLRRAGRPRRS